MNNGILVSRKKKELLLFATTQIDFEGIMLSEVNQRKTNTYYAYMWNLKKPNA